MTRMLQGNYKGSIETCEKPLKMFPRFAFRLQEVDEKNRSLQQ